MSCAADCRLSSWQSVAQIAVCLAGNLLRRLQFVKLFRLLNRNLRRRKAEMDNSGGNPRNYPFCKLEGQNTRDFIKVQIEVSGKVRKEV